jgi:hypothetical protein
MPEPGILRNLAGWSGNKKTKPWDIMKQRITEGEGEVPDDAADELKLSLVTRYRKLFVDKLTQEDVEELQFLLRNKFDADRAINQDYLLKFEVRLGDFFTRSS